MKSLSLLLTLSVLFASVFAHSGRRNSLGSVAGAVAVTGGVAALAAGAAILAAINNEMGSVRRVKVVTKAAKKAVAAALPVVKAAAITGVKATGTALIGAAKTKLNRARRATAFVDAYKRAAAPKVSPKKTQRLPVRRVLSK